MNFLGRPVITNFEQSVHVVRNFPDVRRPSGLQLESARSKHVWLSRCWGVVLFARVIGVSCAAIRVPFVV